MLLNYAKSKLEKKNLDLVVANDITKTARVLIRHEHRDDFHARKFIRFAVDAEARIG
jgi:phosphopantothenoylcysteine synthetase/decarboxylase